MKNLQIEENNLVKAWKRFRAINHPLRSKMLQLVHKHGALHVKDIYKKLKIEQSVASQHLSILREANLVQTKRDRRYILYAVNYSELNKQIRIANRLLGLLKENS